MSKRNKSLNADDLPSLSVLEAELSRVKYKSKYGKILRSTVYTLITVAAIAVLVATLWMPVLQVSGTSMVPTLGEGSIVVSFKTEDLKRGDVIAFYINNKILVKRLIALPGDTVEIDENGRLYVNGVMLDEPYVDEYAFGETDIEMPYKVKKDTLFVMGDHRSVSVDSRNTAVGCIPTEDVVGKIIFRIWPINEFSFVS